jgi:hypothetical protein
MEQAEMTMHVIVFYVPETPGANSEMGGTGLGRDQGKNGSAKTTLLLELVC